MTVDVDVFLILLGWKSFCCPLHAALYDAQAFTRWMRKIPVIPLVLLSVPLQKACAGKWMEECCCDPIGSELNEEILYKHWNAERLSESDKTAIPKSIWTLHSYLKMRKVSFILKKDNTIWNVEENISQTERVWYSSNEIMIILLTILWLVLVISVDNHVHI